MVIQPTHSYVRLIPKLEIKGPNLVKGIHLEGLRVLGKPEDFARFYYENGADELIYMDVVASLYGRNSLLDMIEKTAKEIFIPLTVGGGLRSLDDIQTVLRAGADKVSLNTAVIQRPELISEAARKFGSSTIVVSVEAKKQSDGSYQAYTDNGRVRTGIEVFGWAKQVAELGAGEILLTSIDRDGTGEGYDVELVHRVAESVSIPVIASGGAGEAKHILNVIHSGKADAVCIASVLHYFCARSILKNADFSAEGNIEFLYSGKKFSKIHEVDLLTIEDYLLDHHILSRFAVERFGAARN